MKYPTSLLTLIDFFRTFPGVGTRSAERFAFHLLNWPEDRLKQAAHHLEHLHEKITFCSKCACLMDRHVACTFCSDPMRQRNVICVVGQVKDVYAIEATGEYRGLYHVLGALLSPVDDFGPENLDLECLRKRCREDEITELIVALDSTIEGDATSLYIKECLEEEAIKISRVAFGLPMGSSFESTDGGTLARALSGRVNF